MKKNVMLALKILLLIFIVAWIGIVIFDYFNARNEKDLSFCLKEEVHVYDKEGNRINVYKMENFEKLSNEEKENMLYTYECLGLGYKFYRYRREFKAIEFGPFFIKERLRVEN
ncbi:MAG: hypothetical protein HFH86_03565 [Bacilli bacterium]|nr:hypothetical protein [Bacilli bacterium]